MPGWVARLLGRYRRPEDEDTRMCPVVRAHELEELRQRQADLARRLAVAEAQARAVRAAQATGGRRAD